MSRAGRFVARALLSGAVAGGAYFGLVSAFGTPAAIDLLPAGADVVLELRGAQALERRLAGTRFSAAFARSETRAWLERTETVAAFDALRLEIGRVTGFTPDRRAAFHVVGGEVAAGWYPTVRGDVDPVPWVAGGRLSARAWAVASALRVARRFGVGAETVDSERVAGRTLYTFPGDAGQSLHLFFAGRVVVAGSDRALVLGAASAAADAAGGVSRTPSLSTVRDTLPADGELFAWVRNPDWLPAFGSAGRAQAAPVGARVRAGKAVEIDVAAVSPADRAEVGAAAADGPMPGVALLGREPLLFFSSREPPPPALLALLRDRQHAVSLRRGTSSPPARVLQPAPGYALSLTGADGGSGLFPAPQGLLIFGMADAAAAGRALPLLFPPGARTARLGSTLALATRESFPLAGEFELWGATDGPRLVFATDASLIAAVTEGTGPVTADDRRREPDWRVSSLASVSMTKALPLLRRWSAPLSGLIGARWPEAPQAAADIDLLAAVRTVRLVAGSDGRFERAAITLDVGDLP